MSQIENIAKEASELIKKYDADYIEAHFEESASSHISYRGKKLDSVDSSRSIGGNIRAKVKGGWGFTSFNNPDNLNRRIEQAISQAKLVSRGDIALAPAEAIVDTVLLDSDKNPFKIPLSAKKELASEYNDIIWRTPGLQTSVVSYGDSVKKSIFVNSIGSFINQERADITVYLMAVATDGKEVQQSGISMGSRGDFSRIRTLHPQVKEMADKAIELLTAPQAKGGEYTVVLDPVLAGVFVHEAFGHLSEADFVYENENLRQLMTLGKEFGTKELNIVDGAAVPGLRGSFKYDDEGTPATKTYLIREGKLTGRLHSRETAARMGEAATGNARAVSYRYPPIVRMTNTYIEPGTATFEEMISGIKEGIYAKNWYGGTTSMEMFTFSAGEAYMIRNGKIAELIRPVVLTGNVFETLKNIDAIGNDLDMNEGGGCGKGGQFPLPVSNGSPHIRIRHCLVGGA
ncbi:MAG: TldD/PmbA family protein [Dehalococcoidales bacterium]|nr:TldD/PmbA family protein [Dehalococcoidales bacterium]